MKQSSLAKLETRFGRSEALVLPWLLGGLAGLAVPSIILLGGWIIELLLQASHHPSLPSSIQLGSRLTLSTDWLGASVSPFRGILSLLVLAIGLAIVEAVLLLQIYRWANHYAVEFEVWLRRGLFAKNIELVARQSAIGQKAAFHEATSYWIPQVRDSLLAWYRSFHRHSIQAIGCFIPAALIHPMLMLLAAVGFILLWRFYSMIDWKRRQTRPVLAERSQLALDRLNEFTQQAPLLSSIHPTEIIRENFESQLRVFRDAESRLSNSFLWKTPLLIAVVSLMVAVFLFVITVRILRDPLSLSVSAALTMLVLIGLGLVSVLKAKRAWTRGWGSDAAASRLLASLEQTVAVSSHPRGTIAPLERELRLDQVTIGDTLGQRMLEGIQLHARPGMLVALLATSEKESRSLGELLVGLGAPTHGRLLWDNHPTTDYDPKSVQNRCLWIDEHGPLLSGTVADNLSSGNEQFSTADLVDAARLAGVYETVADLADGFSTLVSPQDDRFKEDSLFRLGIARALLKQVSVVVAQEPSDRVSPKIEQETLAALRQLTQRGMIVVVLAKRLSTLRQADQVWLLHEHRIESHGNHVELLEKSGLYRHLNYVRFSPLRNAE